MIDRIQQVFGLRYAYTNPIERQRAFGLLLTNYAAGVGLLALLAFIASGTLRGNFFGAWSYPTITIALSPVALLLVHWLIQNGRLGVASVVFVLWQIIVIVPSTIFSETIFVHIFTIVPLVAAGVLLPRRWQLVVIAVLVASLLVRMFFLLPQPEVQRISWATYAVPEFIAMTLALMLPAAFLLAFAGSSERVANKSLADIGHFRVSSDLFSEQTIDSSEDVILTGALKVLQRDLGYDLAEIFLAGSDQQYNQRARLLADGETLARLTVRASDARVVNEAARLRQMLVFESSDAARGTHIIPPSRHAALIPMLYGGNVVGVLDVQTKRADGFTENQLISLQSVAQQTGRSLVYQADRAEIVRTLREQERSALRLREQLNELQGRNKGLEAGWSRYLQGGQAFGYDIFQEGDQFAPVARQDLPPIIREALARGEVYVEERSGDRVINVPIVLRGEMLGAMSFTVGRERPITPRHLDMLRVVAERLGVALENNRLFEQTQTQAARERKAGEIASRLLSATNIEAVLGLAAESFNEALGAVYTRVVLDPGTLDDGGASANGANSSVNGNGNGNGKHHGEGER